MRTGTASTLDPQTEVMVTSGATEAVAGALFGLIEPGDEVVVFAPAYDAYLPLVRRAGGIPRLVRLQPPDWRLTEEALRSVFNAQDEARACSTTRTTRPRSSIRARTWNCLRASARSSTRSRSATRSGSTWCSMVASTFR